MSKFLFTSESVTEGHPDKVCDRISDAVLDAMLEQDNMSRVACESFASTGTVTVMGEITTKAEVDIENIIKAQLSEDCLVTYNDNSIEVIMPKGTVKDDNIVKIKDIVISKTDLPSEKIIVIELK